MKVTGHIRKRETSRGKKFQLIIERDSVDGKRKRDYLTLPAGTSKKAAEKKLRELLAEYEQDSFLPKSKISVQEWMRQFQELYVKTAGLSPTTQDSYRDAIDNYILPLLGDRLLQDVTPLLIQRWINQIAETSPASGQPLAPKTVINKYQCLKKALDIAVQMELLKENPALKVTLPKRKKFKCEIYTDEQIQALLQSVQGTDLELPIELEISIGLRRGELLGLKYSQVDFDKHTLTVAENIVSVNGKNCTKEPKTEAGNRTVQLSAVLTAKLQQQRAYYLERKLRYGSNFHETDLVFCKENGDAYNADYFSEKFRRHLKRHGLPHMRFHDLRHICASVYLDHKVSPKVISQILGHNDISTTLSIYSHVMEKSSQEAVNKMSDYLYGSQGQKAQ